MWFFPYICHWAVIMEYQSLKILNINLFLETFISYDINKYNFSTLRKTPYLVIEWLDFLRKIEMLLCLCVCSLENERKHVYHSPQSYFSI